jgi:hypothetical protein
VALDRLEGTVVVFRSYDNLRAAHSSAVNTANAHASDLIVAATGRHAYARGRHEHGDWAERTLELESAGLHPTSATYRWASQALRIAHRPGIAKRTYPQRPDGRCRRRGLR